jgi:signal transduction histidine kinase
VAVGLGVARGMLRLVVTDRGPGFDPAAAADPGHLGLAGMRERAELLGGDFRVRSAAGRGTTVEVSWPLAGEMAG